MKSVAEMTQEEKERIQAESEETLAAWDKKHGVIVGEDGYARYPGGKLRMSLPFGLQFPLGLNNKTGHLL